MLTESVLLDTATAECVCVCVCVCVCHLTGHQEQSKFESLDSVHSHCSIVCTLISRLV